MTSGGRPTEARDGLASRRDEVLEVLADGMRVAKVVVLLNQGLDESLFGRAPDLANVERPELCKRHGERNGGDLHFCDYRVATRFPGRPLRRRQDEMPLAVELEHQPATEGIAGCAIGLRPGPGLADLERERSSGGLRRSGDELSEEGDITGVDFASPELEQRVHPQQIAPQAADGRTQVALLNRREKSGSEARHEGAPLRRGLGRVGIAARQEHL